jgi:hypothetical protein
VFVARGGGGAVLGQDEPGPLRVDVRVGLRAVRSGQRRCPAPVSPKRVVKTLKAMLDEGKCEAKAVPDGIRLDLMSTYEKGRPVVVGPLTKKLGREDQATVCDVGNGVTTYFFIGEVSSCGNLAFVVERPEVEEVGRVTEKPPGDNCRWVEDQVSVRTEPGQIYTTAPTVVSGCGGSVVLGGNLYQEPTKQYAQSSARKVCD